MKRSRKLSLVILILGTFSLFGYIYEIGHSLQYADEALEGEETERVMYHTSRAKYYKRTCLVLFVSGAFLFFYSGNKSPKESDETQATA